MKAVRLILFLMIGMLTASPLLAEDQETAEEKAARIHQLASSDVIYTQEETKALYYQNQQIIDLLKEIRDLLDARLEKK